MNPSPGMHGQGDSKTASVPERGGKPEAALAH